MVIAPPRTEVNRLGVRVMGKEFGRLLRRLRDERKLSQQALATAVGIEQSYVSNIERGRSLNASPEVVARLCAALQVPPDTFAASLRPDAPTPDKGEPTPVAFDLTLPLLGVVAAGPGLESDYAVGEQVRFADLFRGADGVYQCAGDSMRGEGVLPGDFLAVRRDPDPPHGSTVFARLEDGGHLVKILSVEGGVRKLLSRPGDRRPDPITLIEGDAILGVMVGVIRSTRSGPGKGKRR